MKKCFILIILLLTLPDTLAKQGNPKTIKSSEQLLMRLYKDVGSLFTTTNILVTLGILGVAGATWLISDLWKQKNEPKDKKVNNQETNIPPSGQTINLDKKNPSTTLQNNVIFRKNKDVHLLSPKIAELKLTPLTGDTISFRIKKGAYITDGVIKGEEKIKKLKTIIRLKTESPQQWIIQLKVFNQLKLPKDESGNNGLKQVGDNCPLLALYNSYCLYKFYYSGNEDSLRDLNDQEKIISFYRKLDRPPATLNEKELREYITKVQEKYNFKNFSKRIFIIDTFPTNTLDLTTIGLNANWSTNQKSNIFRAFIIPTSDEIKSPSKSQQKDNYRSHWYVVALLKKGPVIQYVVMDSEPEADPLTGKFEPIEYWDADANQTATLNSNSYNLNRIFFIIELLTKGNAMEILLNNDEENK